MRLDKHDRKKMKELNKIYRPMDVYSDEKKIKNAQEKIKNFYESGQYSFNFLHLRYYYLKAYETTFSTQISFLFGTATTVAITILSKEVFKLVGLSDVLSILLSFMISLATVFFFTFCGLYIGISIGSIVGPIKRAYLYPYELIYVEKQLQKHDISLSK